MNFIISVGTMGFHPILHHRLKAVEFRLKILRSLIDYFFMIIFIIMI